MKLLMIHADYFQFYKLEKVPQSYKTDLSEFYSDSAEIKDCLVIFCAVETIDESNIEFSINHACEEIEQICLELSVNQVVIYPYSHLSSSLASFSSGEEIILGLYKKLIKKFKVTLAPYGWYKHFKIECKGHPRSETFRDIIPVQEKVDVVVQKGKEHPVLVIIEKLRKIFLNLGLDEIINPCIVSEEDIYKQYGDEAPVILDRVFYLAGLPRPDIGISDSDNLKIKEIFPPFNQREKLQELLREYKKGEIESDDLVEIMTQRMKFSREVSMRIINEVFPAFKELKPEPTKKTLRSHMTSLWYLTLVELQKRKQLPIKLFSIGLRFRREQREDPRHLFESTSASVVVMDDLFSLQDGYNLTKKILNLLGFSKVKFKTKKVSSNYYEEGTDTEVYATFDNEEIEVGNLGFYSKRSLANYGIEHNVFNIGFGVERLAMIFEKVSDIRALVYPQFYEEVYFTDEEIIKMLGPEKEPQTTIGKEIEKKLLEMAKLNKDKLGPSTLVAFKGKGENFIIEASLYNWDEGKPLLSFAAMNKIFVYNGNIYGLPEDAQGLEGELSEAFKKGIFTDYTFLDLIIKGAVAEIEGAINRKEEEIDLKYKMIKRPSQINLKIPENIQSFITGKYKRIKIGGPIFAGIKAKIKYID